MDYDKLYMEEMVKTSGVPTKYLDKIFSKKLTGVSITALSDGRKNLTVAYVDGKTLTIVF